DPYLNLDPGYPEQDADEFTFPTGANKTWGRLQLAFFTIRGCYKTGTAFGALGGLQLVLKKTQSMVWSKPRNAKYVAKQGMLQGNTQGYLGLPPGVCGIAPGGTAGRALTGLSALHANWEYMKGSTARHSE
ncbi:TIM23 translocase, partial [Pelecanoides urinatrix]|nr:TIM23 translocase [Pelecanoides urinatrix]